MGNYEWETAIRRITDLMLGEIQSRHLFFPAGLDNLYILTSGEKVENPANLVNSARMEATIARLRDFFDFVIMDTAPALQSSETSILATKIDAAILLTEHEKLPRGTLVKFRGHLEQLKVKVAGLVVNKGKITEL
jgi:Mrp family chromosome partitioning ATPase